MFGSICAQRDVELEVGFGSARVHSLRCARKSVRARARQTAGDIVSGPVYFFTWAGTCCEVWDYWCPWWRQVGGRKRGEAARMRRSRRRRKSSTFLLKSRDPHLPGRRESATCSIFFLRAHEIRRPSPCKSSKTGDWNLIAEILPAKKPNSHSQFVLHDVSWYLLNIFANARDRPF